MVAINEGRVKKLGAALVLLGALLLVGGCGKEEEKGPPPLPMIYSGSVMVAGTPAPKGLRVLALVDGYESGAVTVEGGRYAGLTVAPPGSSYLGKRVQFFLVAGGRRVQAVEVDAFRTGGTPELKSLDLSFPRLAGQP